MTSLRGPSRSLIDAARPAERPTDADRERVRARVMARVAGAGAAAVVVTAASKAAGQVAAGSAAATAGGTVAGSASAAAGGAVVAAGVTAGIVKAVVIGAVAGVCALGATQITRAPAAPPPVPSAAPSAIVERAPAAAPPPDERAVEAPRPVASAPEPRVARPESRPTGSAGIRDELEILKEAQRAIAAGETDRAVALLDEHQSRWKGGALAEERLAARAIALCDAGRREEARRAALRFLSEAKGSPLEARVRAACASVLAGGESP